jgi:2-dehydro-3-deoxyphosphogluconate aldolase/(4S)-4-hydroxy-2-oxoglutarate aldolase
MAEIERIVEEKIRTNRIIPVIAIEQVDRVVSLCEALLDGGLPVAEITFRTSTAAEAIRTVSKEFPKFVLGAGTVSSEDELEEAHASGAQFAVSPGLMPDIVRRAKELKLPFYPGVCTPTEIEEALTLGCRILKFFPASAMGGPKTIRAMYAPFRHRRVSLIPTGGINAENVKEYLSEDGVIAVGGSWLVPKDKIQSGDWGGIESLTREAVAIARDTES